MTNILPGSGSGTYDHSQIATGSRLPDRHSRPFSTWAIFPRRSQDLFHFSLIHRMTINVRQAGFWINVEPDGHLTQLSLERAVEHGLKQIVHLAAGGGLLSFRIHYSNRRDAGGEVV